MRGSYTCFDSADSAKSLMVVGAHAVFVRDQWALSCEVKSWSCGKAVVSFFLTRFPGKSRTQSDLDPDFLYAGSRLGQF